MPISKHRVRNIIQRLNELYPDVMTPLIHTNPFQLLIATILSAQCTDKQVNSVTPELFRQFPTPQSLAEAPLFKIEKIIRSTGFYRMKAKNIQACSRILWERYDGEVPSSLEELIKLPGVGRKTANVVLGSAFGIPGIVVDTHVMRVSRLLGLSSQREPEKIEKDLMNWIPRKYWNTFSLQLIQIGRSFCPARRPQCNLCPLCQWCDYARSL